MIDLHCHILPMVDDGADCARTACAMARHALEGGVDTIVATPHCNLRGALPNLRGRALEARLGLLRTLLRREGLPLTILPGCEFLAQGPRALPLLEAGRIMTLNRSRYLLMEFSFGASPREMNRTLEAISRMGYVPVIAHPERYDAVQYDLRLAGRWFHRGFIIQVNKGSLLGLLGEGAALTGMELLNRGLVHVVASDAHNCRSRTAGFRSLLPLLRDTCPREYVRLLLEENPRRIICDEPIPLPHHKAQEDYL